MSPNPSITLHLDNPVITNHHSNQQSLYSKTTWWTPTQHNTKSQQQTANITHIITNHSTWTDSSQWSSRPPLITIHSLENHIPLQYTDGISHQTASQHQNPQYNQLSDLWWTHHSSTNRWYSTHIHQKTHRTSRTYHISPAYIIHIADNL